MTDVQCISPIDGQVFCTTTLSTEQEIVEVIQSAKDVFPAWKSTPVKDRIEICTRFVDKMEADVEKISRGLAMQMGRPIRYGCIEVRGLAERARYMISIAEKSLADVPSVPKEGFERFIRKEPLGVVFIVAAWNYPYLIAVNAVIPAILAGNSVILKHSAQTPLAAKQFEECFIRARLPENVFQILQLSHAQTARVIKDPCIDFVAFTGSVEGGRQIQKAASERFIGVGLELGGKDPAYVRKDANIDNAVENLVDGSFFNSGQSCCGIERIYVDENVYEEFVEKFVKLTKEYKLGDPLENETTLGPCVKTSAASWVRTQIQEAVAAGAKALIDETAFPMSKDGTPYLAPQVLVDVTHEMKVMKEESFGPVIGIMKVTSDEEAVMLMNDSDFGLTASVWTSDVNAIKRIGDEVQTGTFFSNRCDYLDPALAWVGVKDSGRGCTLSAFGFDHLTRPKSFHLKL